MKLIISILTLLLFHHCVSQVQSFHRTYGIDGFNEGKRLKVLNDTTYLLMGNKSGFQDMNNVYLIHADKSGMIIKDKVFGDQSLFYGTDLAAINDTLFAVTGYTLNSESEEYDIFIMWIDLNLNLLLVKQFPAQSWDFGKAAISDATGNIYIAGLTYSFGTKPAVILLKYDTEGNVINQLIIQHPEIEYAPEAMIIANDSMIFISGSSQKDSGSGRGMILKTDTGFNHVDSIFYQVDTLNVYYNDIALVGNDRISVTGYYTNINNDIQKLFYHSYTTDLLMNGAIWDHYPNSFCNSITSSTFNETALGCLTTTFGAGNGDFFFIRFDFNTYLHSNTAGGSMRDELSDIAYALDSSLVMIGTTQSFGSPVKSIMFSKTCKDYSFCVTDYLHITTLREETKQSEITIFPNPANDFINIDFPNQNNLSDCKILIFTLTGQQIVPEFQVRPGNSIKINIEQLFQGIYFLIIETTSGCYQTRFIKI